MILVSSDQLRFEVDLLVIARRADGSCAPYHSSILNAIAEDLQAEDGSGSEDTEWSLPIANVDGVNLERVLEFCRHHHRLAERAQPALPDPPDLPAPDDWERTFLDLPARALRELMQAAQFLQVEALTGAVARKFARMIVVEDMSVAAIRELFDITGDFTPEEEETIKAENQWLMSGA